MKRIISLIISLLPLISMAQGNNIYVLEGKSNTPATVTLQYIINGDTVKKTGELKNGELKLTGTIEAKMEASFIIMPHQTVNSNSQPVLGTILHFWLEPGHIKISGLDSIAKKPVVFSGTPLNNDEIAYKLALKSNSEKYEKLPPSPVNQPETPELAAAHRILEKERSGIELEFIKTHPNSLVSLTILYYNYRSDSNSAIPDVAVVEPLLNSLSAEVRSSALGKKYQALLNTWTNVQIGSVAPDFKQFDQNGKQVNLSDFKGKYILIDFWASWCHPCRWENPNLIKQHQLYKNKNFIIISISMDGHGFGDKADWLKAISDDHIGEWPQLVDLVNGYNKNEARIRYGVSSIPEDFLVDPEGKIIGKDLRGEELNSKLKTIFNPDKL